MSKYSNYKTFLTSNGYTVSTSPEEFKSSASITFECPQGHSTTIKATSFGNKKSSIQHPQDMCTQCFKNSQSTETLALLQQEILSLNGHRIVSMVDTKSVSYICGNCSAPGKTCLQNLRRGSGKCPQCQNLASKNTYYKVVEEVTSLGFKMLWSESQFNIKYKNKDQPLPMQCPCLRETEIKLQDVRAGKRCMGCRSSRIEATSLEKYGVSNPSKSSEIKEKIVTTNIQRLGVAYPQQNPDVLAKTKNTCMEKFGKEFSFNQDWVYSKIRETHLAKHGVEFPLQSKEIQDKVTKTCLERFGVARPLLSQEIMEKIKKVMQEKYQCDFFFQSPSFSQTMIDRYGTANAMQVPKFFHKAMKTAFSTKPYTFPSGRVENIMGFENYCLDHLLTNSMINEEDIFVGDQVPVIRYCDEVGKKRTYYPDIFIKSSNTIIEVKSIWTFNLCPDRNFYKMTNVAENGYESVLFIIDAKKVLDILTFTVDGVSSQRIKNFDYTKGYPVGDVEEVSDEDANAIVEEAIMDTLEDEVLDTLEEDSMCDDVDEASEAGPSDSL